MPIKTERMTGLYRMPDSKYWWFRYRKDGQRHAVSLKTTDEGEATTRAQAILAEGLIAAQTYTPNEPVPRKREIHGLIDRYLKEAQNRNRKPLRDTTADVRRYILQKFVKDCAINQVGGITLPKIQGWLDQLKAEGKAKDTCWGHGQRVRSFVKYLVDQHLLRPSILQNLTVPEQASVGRKNWVRKDNVTKLLDAASGDPVLKFALLCGFDAGLRRAEISEARVGWFDLETGMIDISNNAQFQTKDRDNRTFLLTDRFLAFLKVFLTGRDKNEYVLAPHKTVKGLNKYRYDTNKRVRSHIKRCGIKCSLHDMRRSFASNRVSAGTSIYKVAGWLGDGIVTTARSYGHLEPHDREINRGV